MLSAKTLATSPDWLPLRFQDGHRLELLRVRRSVYEQSVFLDRRIALAHQETEVVDCNALLQRLPATTPTLGYIFHIAFCGSTLLSRALAFKGNSFAIREPWILLDLAARVETGAASAEEVELISRLLGRSYEETAVVVKPSVLSNNLIEPLMTADPKARALLLCNDLKSFLISNLKKTQATKDKIPWLLDTLWRRLGTDGELPNPPDWMSRCALIWHLHMRHFLRITETGLVSRLAVMSGEQFLHQRRREISRAARHLGVPWSDGTTGELMLSGLMKRNAKAPGMPYDRRQRDAERQVIQDRFGRAIHQAMGWYRDQLGDPELLLQKLLASDANAMTARHKTGDHTGLAS